MLFYKSFKTHLSPSILLLSKNAIQPFSYYTSLSEIFFFSFFFVFFLVQPWPVEVPRLAVKLQLQLQAYATATAMPDLSCLCNLCYSLQQHQMHNPLSKVKDRACIPMDTSWVPNPLSQNRNSWISTFFIFKVIN